MNLYQPTISGSLTVSGSVEIIGPFTMSGGSISGTSSFAANAGLLQGLDSTSFVGTGSFNSMSSSVSTRVTKIEGNYATTGSNIFLGAQTVCANITSTGTIIAQTLNVQQVTSSVVYSSGSNVFGCSLANTQQFTGSVTMTGSLAVFTAGTTPEFQVVTGGTIKGNALTDVHQVTGSLRVTGSGNHWFQSGCVGIGTTNPANLLHVSSSLPRIIADTSNRYAVFNLYVNGGEKAAYYWDNTDVITKFESCTGYVFLGCGTTIDSLRINSCGRVGINTDNFTMTGLAGLPLFLRSSSSNTGQTAIVIQDYRKCNRWAINGQSQTDDFTFAIFSTPNNNNDFTRRMSISQTGEICFNCQVCAPMFLATSCIGIGTATPNSALEVKQSAADNSIRLGSIAATPAYNMVSLNGSNAEGVYLGIAGGATSDPSLYIQSGNSGCIVFRTGNGTSFATRMTLTQGGNVGIGTCSPSTTLTVNDSGGSKTNSIDIIAQGNTTRGHIGQFNNKLYISSNWFFNGSQNADTTSFGQAAIVFDTQNVSTGTGIEFSTSEIGATVPVARGRITSAGIACFACQICAPIAQLSQQSYFYAFGLGAGNAACGQRAVVYTSICRSRGLHGYCITNGRMTACYSGVYSFSWVYLYQNATVPGACIDDGFSYNGELIFGGNRYRVCQLSWGDCYVSVKGSVNLFLNQGEYFEVRTNNTGDAGIQFYGAPTWGYLTGAFLG